MTLRIPKAKLDAWGIAHEGRTSQQIADDLNAAVAEAEAVKSRTSAAAMADSLYAQVFPESAASASPHGVSTTFEPNPDSFAPLSDAEADALYAEVWPERKR